MSAERLELLRFAVDMARQAGDLTLRYFRTAIATEWKADHTPVTIADREAERLLRERISAAFPHDGLVGEEMGASSGHARRWILDPIDGTYSFINGVPLYSVLVAVEEAGAPVVGVVHFPALNETVLAATGLGCWWIYPQSAPFSAGATPKATVDRAGTAPTPPVSAPPGLSITRARVSSCDRLDAARLTCTGTKPLSRYGREAAFVRLRDTCYADRAWSDAFAYALVATGRADVAIDPRMELWDVAALVPVIQEAGGRITDWSGEASYPISEAIATNGALHDTVIDLLTQK